MSYTAHQDTFSRDHLPPREQWPELIFELPELQFPERLNCATELLDRWVEAGQGDRLCIQGEGLRWTYADLQAQANAMAHVLVQDLGLVPGNRVLLRGANTPYLAACWFAIQKAGGIAVATMPLLRCGELVQVIQKAEVSHALCDERLIAELRSAQAKCPTLRQVLLFHSEASDGLEARAANKPGTFRNVDTGAEDCSLIAFTSGTTGKPKGTMHFHRDVMAICRCWPPHVLKPLPEDVFIGSPPLAFTFGLGGLLLFPMTVGASTVLLEKASPEALLAAIETYRATICFTAPTSYRVMSPQLGGHDVSCLRRCVSAGEALPAATRALWKAASGIELIDGIGATELLHIFISHEAERAKPGATGVPVPGYRAVVLDDAGYVLPAGQVGRLAVKGPTGCRYLADDRQQAYVLNGWNLTGDAYCVDVDGYFIYQARTDDMIISGGYNIAGPEVEACLLLHPSVAECGVVGQADEARGQIVKAFVVLRAGEVASDALVQALQDFVKAHLAPYKYPRVIEFCATLPRTETGKLQRFRLRENGP
ncbi:AMP-binding protein [Roseateles koreensis]|uniref:AMP-binding protein n=1 Tax=Roseateles koreensis TaxID=2987526 RepID=A0ABT5KT12_9BURK|nr:AMP-binding protein [Roseateles koreensis]MDC8786059.1 AMP-binding protein [Roseateles koreensis]